MNGSFLASVLTLLCLCDGSPRTAAVAAAQAHELRIHQDTQSGAISVIAAGPAGAIVTQYAEPHARPLLQPHSLGPITGDRPPPQTGLYWGFPQVNGQDFFHRAQGEHWRRVSATVTKPVAAVPGDSVQWQTVYDLLDAAGDAVLRETQLWTMFEQQGAYVLDLQWTGHAKTQVTIGRSEFGGLFLGMPWNETLPGSVVNSARQSDSRADGQRAVWLDVAKRVTGSRERAHLAIFDHPSNRGFPQAWHVDRQLGVGLASTQLGDWQLAAGEQAVVRHRLLVYAGEMGDVELTRRWSEFSGQRLPSAQWSLARQEGREAELLTPQQAVAAMTVPAGFRVNVFAAEPMIQQPMAFCWDDRGRLWIAENRDYETRRSGFSAAGNSRILILEDTDRDGTADVRKVFKEGIPFPAAIAVGFGGLWLGAPPNLLFLPDRDHDDQADAGATQVRLTGWGIRDRHETLNSFHWGPDGWLYGCQGFATPSKVGRPAGAGRVVKAGEPFPQDIALAEHGVEINGGVWRYHPIKQRFEVVAHGFSNPWGIDYDARGQLFITACVIPHLWHVIPGGIYHRQGGRHFSPYVYSDIRTIADHRHRSAHGGARIYLSDAFPAQYHDRLFMANIHEHAVLTDVLEPRGSGFVGRHGDDFLLANNAQWVGFSIEIGPDGAVYVLDWHDADICGTEVLAADTGRVFRVAPQRSGAADWPGRYADLRSLSDQQLVQLQLSTSAWHARRARLILQYRAASRGVDQQAIAALRTIYHTRSEFNFRLRAMWTLHITDSVSTDFWLQSLTDPDEYVRGWAVQLLCEDLAAPAAALDQFVRMAAADPSPVVRLYLASALQRMGSTARWRIASQLAARSEDADDHNIPQLVWFGLEPLVVQDPEGAIRLAGSSKLPLLTRHVARRMADADQLERLVAGISRYAGNRVPLLQGLSDGLEGRYDVPAPKNWPQIAHQLQVAGGQPADLSLALSQQFGDSAAARTMLRILRNQDSELEQRRKAIRALAGQQHPQLPPLLLSLLGQRPLRREVIRAMAAFDDDRLTRALLDRYASFRDEEKLEAVHTLAARSRSGAELTRAIERGDVPKREIPAYVARVLRRVVGNRFVDAWGPIDGLTADKEALIARYYALLGSEAMQRADARQGRAVFQRTCLSCHKMFGEGGQVGPEITGANRTSLDYLLGNILTPSDVIQDAYKMQLIRTGDGRVYSGIPAGENQRQLRLRVANQAEPIVIAKSQIESREVASVSMMPEGLLKTLTEQEVLDLFAYLRAPQQVPLPD